MSFTPEALYIIRSHLSAEHSMQITVGYCDPASGQVRKLLCLETSLVLGFHEMKSYISAADGSTKDNCQCWMNSSSLGKMVSWWSLNNNCPREF